MNTRKKALIMCNLPQNLHHPSVEGCDIYKIDISSELGFQYLAKCKDVNSASVLSITNENKHQVSRTMMVQNENHQSSVENRIQKKAEILKKLTPEEISILEIRN